MIGPVYKGVEELETVHQGKAAVTAMASLLCPSRLLMVVVVVVMVTTVEPLALPSHPTNTSALFDHR